MSEWYIKEADANGPRSVTNGTMHLRLIPESKLAKTNLTNIERLFTTTLMFRDLIDGHCIDDKVYAAVDYMLNAVGRRRNELRQQVALIQYEAIGQTGYQIRVNKNTIR